MKQTKQTKKGLKTMKNTNTTTSIPTSLNELTKEFMFNYILNNAPEHKDWFKKLVTEKVVIKRKTRSGEIKDIEQPQTFAEVRTQFAKKFFPTFMWLP